MPHTLNCPKCYAPLNYEGGDDPAIRCPYCGASVSVPETLRAPTAESPLSEGPFTPSDDPLQQALQLAPKLKEIARLAKSGQKIEAIKLFRKTFGVGLAEAKDAVEKIEAGQFVQVANITLASSPATAASGDSASQLAALQQLLQAGKKIEAIKLYRQMTGVGLKEAKEAVEAMEAGRPVEFASLTLTSTSAAGMPGDPSTQMAAVHALLQAGKKIEAIKLYRQMTGVGLKEAKDAVERLEAGQPIEEANFAVSASAPYHFPQTPSPVVSPEPGQRSGGGLSCVVWAAILIGGVAVVAGLGLAVWVLANLR